MSSTLLFLKICELLSRFLTNVIPQHIASRHHSISFSITTDMSYAHLINDRKIHHSYDWTDILEVLLYVYLDAKVYCQPANFANQIAGNDHLSAQELCFTRALNLIRAASEHSPSLTALVGAVEAKLATIDTNLWSSSCHTKVWSQEGGRRS